MNPKSLLSIFGGMTLSFGLILAIMLAAVDTKPKPRRRTTRSSIQHEAPAQNRTAKSPPRLTRRARLTQQRTSSTAPPADAEVALPPTVASETLPAPAPSAAIPIAPNKVAMRQLSTLKQDLNRELQTLKKDRNAMLKSLSQALVVLPPKEIAQEISTLDDQGTLTVLRALPPQARSKVLEHIEGKRAQQFRKRLK